MADMLRRTVGDGPLPALPFTAGRGWLIQLGKLDFDLPWIVEELTWPDQEELGRRMSLEGLAGIAEQRDDRPAVEAICLNRCEGAMRGSAPRCSPRFATSSATRTCRVASPAARFG